MNILGLLGNLPFTVFNCPSPRDYYERGVRDTLEKIEREKQALRQVAYVYKVIADNHKEDGK